MKKIKAEIRWLLHDREKGFTGLPRKTRKQTVESLANRFPDNKTWQDYVRSLTCVKVRIAPFIKPKPKKGKKQ